jgi:hypothetical protein
MKDAKQTRIKMAKRFQTKADEEFVQQTFAHPRIGSVMNGYWKEVYVPMKKRGIWSQEYWIKVESLGKQGGRWMG